MTGSGGWRHPRGMEDLARAVEMRAARLQDEVNELVGALGLVEVEVVVGEEPEEGVALEVTTDLREQIGGPIARGWHHLSVHQRALIAEKFIATDPGEIIEIP